MTDVTSAPSVAAPGWSRSEAAARQLQQRHRADRRLKIYGMAAIVIALSLLVILLGSIFIASWTAWTQTQVRIDITLDPDEIDAGDPFRARYRNVVRDAVYALFPAVEGAAAHCGATKGSSDHAPHSHEGGAKNRSRPGGASMTHTTGRSR